MLSGEEGAGRAGRCARVSALFAARHGDISRRDGAHAPTSRAHADSTAPPPRSFPDLAAEREARDAEERAKIKAEAKSRAKAEKELDEARRKEKEARSYDTLFGKKPAGGGGAGGGGGGGGGGAGGKAAGGKKKKLGEGRNDEAGGLEGDMMGLGISGTADAAASRAYEDGFM